jgi:hypothetical protein
MNLTDLASYLILSAVSHTAAKVSEGLLPPLGAGQRRLAGEWLSSVFGVAMAFTTGIDLLADLGLTVLWPPAGLVVTGLLLGQGVGFSMQFLRGLPDKHNTAVPPAA